MKNKCKHNILLHEQASRNEYQYKAAIGINKYILCQQANHGSKNCLNQIIRTPFLKAKPCIFIKCNQVEIWHYIISMKCTLINKNDKQHIFVESNVKRLSKRIMCFGTPAI